MSETPTDAAIRRWQQEVFELREALRQAELSLNFYRDYAGHEPVSIETRKEQATR